MIPRQEISASPEAASLLQAGPAHPRLSLQGCRSALSSPATRQMCETANWQKHSSLLLLLPEEALLLLLAKSFVLYVRSSHTHSLLTTFRVALGGP